MKKVYLLLLSILCFVSTPKAQQEIDFNQFKRLQSSGKVPDDITKLYIEKYNDDKSTIEKSNRRSENKAKDQFLQESNFYINQLLISGKVLFNDPVTKYINVIADNILKEEPELRKTLRFYVVKSPSVNAFSTDKGIIFVNLGLIAQVTSEAQLAYVLSHEIVHYVRKHNMDFYMTKNKILKNKRYENDDVDESFLKVHHRSREMESDADNYGLTDYYSKSNYSLSEIDGAMDVLQYAYLPFDDIKFDKSYFESPYFKFPDTYRLENLTPIKGKEDYEDTLSTHPNVLKRREALKELVKSMDNKGKQAFVQPKELFNTVKTLARFECINQFIIDQNYDDAIYNSYIMLKEYPNNFYLEKSITTSMYLLAKLRLDGKMSNGMTDYKKLEGESQQLNFLLKKLERKEVCLVALRTIWKTYKQHPENEYLAAIKDNMFKDIFKRLDLKTSDLATSKDTVNPLTIDTVAVEKANNKYDRIKQKKKNTETKEKQNYFNFMLVDLFQDKDFVKDFDKFKKNSKKEDYDEDRVVKRKKRTSNTLSHEESEEEIAALPEKINNIIIFNPFYLKIDERHKEMLKYMSSAQNHIEYIERIKKITKMLKIKTNLLVPTEFTADDVDLYNDYSLVKDLISESLYLPDENNYISNTTQYIDPVITKYNTRYVDLSGVYSSRVKKSSRVILNAFAYACLVYPIPISIYLVAVPEYYTVYLHALFDIKTGKIIYRSSYPFSYRDRSDYLNSQLYNTFNKIKKCKNFNR